MSYSPRIIKVGLELNGKLQVYENLAVRVTGTKYANSIQNRCQVSITNLRPEARNYILSETSPLNPRRTTRKVTVWAGRSADSLAQVIEADIVASTVSQPPDTVLRLDGFTGNESSKLLVSRAQNAQASARAIAEQMAGDLGLKLSFNADDSQVSNWTFTGAASKQIEKLSAVGPYRVFVDDGGLLVLNKRGFRDGQIPLLSADSGMVGVPEINPYGVKVSCLFSPEIQLGGRVEIRSVTNPAADGIYSIYKLEFDLATRDDPFYYTIEAYKIG